MIEFLHNFLFGNVALAAELNYKLSEPLSGGDNPTDISAYLGNLFYFLLGAAAVLALIKITMAGLKYIYAAGDSGKISEAKDDIYWAVLGLILALSSVLILQAIGGKELTSLELGVKKLEVEIPSPPPKTPDPKPGPDFEEYYKRNPSLLSKDVNKGNWTEEEKNKLYPHKEALAQLTVAGITAVGTNGLCENHSKQNCTSLNGIPKELINTLAKTKKECADCEIIVTGGTEVGHKKQGFGAASIDVRYNEALYNKLKSAGGDYSEIVKERNGERGDWECNKDDWKCYPHVTGEHISIYKKSSNMKYY